MDRLTGLRAFVAVADVGGFGAASRRLGLSPARVTRSVAALEASLGVELLRRTTRAVSLTEAGATYLARMRVVLAELDAADAETRATRDEPRGRLVVSAPAAFGRTYVVPLLGVLAHRHPHVTTELLLDDVRPDLAADRVDVAVVIGRLPDTSLVARRIGATRTVLVGSPVYLAARGRPRRLADLERHDVIEVRGVSSERAGERVGRGVPRFATNGTDAALEYARQGAGLVRVPAYQVAAEIRDGTLEVVLGDHEPAPAPIHVLFRGGRHPSASVRAFVRLVVSACDWRFIELPA